MQIDFTDETQTLTDEQVLLLNELLSFTALQEEVEKNAELSVRIVKNDEIQEINRVYRGQDRPTDVISFALQEVSAEETQIISKEIPIILGDIIISIDKAIEQAKEYNHSLKRELGFLTVHGFLHLLGYDHQTKEDEEQMIAKQNDILDAFKVER